MEPENVCVTFFIKTFRREVCSIPKTQTAFINYFLLDMFDAWHEFCDVSIVRDQLKKNLKFWDDMDNKGLTTIEVSLEFFFLYRIFGSGHYSFYKSKIFNEQKFFMN